MHGIDTSLTFTALRIGVLTVSDRHSADTDSSGDLLARRVEDAGHTLVARAIVPGDVDAIRSILDEWIRRNAIDVIISNGGTGFSPRDVVPEAVRPLLTREMDGFPVVFHTVSLASVGISTLQSRVLAGQIERTFVFCLPGSSGACKDGWDGILAMELDSRYRPCSLVGHLG